jgi:uncharacterized protein YggE
MRAFAGLCLCFLFFPALANAQVYGSPTRSLDVSGSATIHVVPDEIFIGVGVESFNASLESATSKNDSSIRAIVNALRSLGIPEQKIRTEAMSVDIAYVDSSRPSKGVDGYFARKNLTVQVGDSATAERAVKASLANGANRILGIQYNTTQMRKLRDEAREKASAAAREKAELLAGQFGAKVGRAMSIREGYSIMYGSSMWNPYGYGGYGQFAQQNVSVSRSESSGDSSDLIPAGEMAVRAEIAVSFELAP